MKKTDKKFQFANGDEMNPVAINGKNFYSKKDVERKILELEDDIRVTLNIHPLANRKWMITQKE